MKRLLNRSFIQPPGRAPSASSRRRLREIPPPPATHSFLWQIPAARAMIQSRRAMIAATRTLAVVLKKSLASRRSGQTWASPSGQSQPGTATTRLVEHRETMRAEVKP